MKIKKSQAIFGQFIADQDGVTAIEYALLAALIFAVIVIAVGFVGNNLAAVFQFLADAF